MNNSFWVRMHGGATHFPIALVLAALLFDVLALSSGTDVRRREFQAAGFYSITLGALLSTGAILSGLMLTKGVLLGTGPIARHHRFVWPAFGLLEALAVWRMCVRNLPSSRTFRCYVAAELVLAALMTAAGYWGGEILLAP